MALFVHLEGLQPYEPVHRLQQQLIEARLAGTIPDVVLLLEHEATITVGRQRGAAAHVLDPGDTPVVQVERGGDVTWHGPGQLVAYPIVLLQGERQDLRRHLHALEQGVIDMLRGGGLPAGRDPRNTGVWLQPEHGPALKVASVGTATRRWVTWHGLALNVTVDLAEQGRIAPCGFEASIMTRLADWIAPLCPPPAAWVPHLAPALATALQVSMQGPVLVADGPEAALGLVTR